MGLTYCADGWTGTAYLHSACRLYRRGLPSSAAAARARRTHR